MSRDALREEHDSLQRAVQSSRRSIVPTVSAFVRAMWAVMDDYHAARADGLSRSEAVAGIESALLEAWPHRPSKFGPNCDACEDTGWREVLCWSDHRCGREMCARLASSHEHRYVVACECAKGDARAGRGRQEQLDEIGQAMRSKPKKRGFSKWGAPA